MTLAPVCLAESYLYEWVRDHVYPDDEAALLALFPNNDRQGIRERWKRATRELHRLGKLSIPPDYGGARWNEFVKLVRYRDGLVHALASRPVDIQKPSAIDAPRPTPSDLGSMTAGSPTNTVVGEIVELHRLAGTTTPSWLATV